MSPIHYCRESPCPICNGAAGGFVDPTILVTTPGYPCDRGIPDNVTCRGWHRFEAGLNGVVVCRHCGRKP